jgi:hypothetical protein
MDPIAKSGEFAVEPLAPTDKAVNLVGGLLSLGATAVGVAFVVTYAGALAAAWPWLLLAGVVALAVATFVADFVSGLLHWTFDTYFSDRNAAVKRMVVLVREHHIHPDRIFQYRVWQEAGVLSWFAALLAAPPYAVAVLATGLPMPVRGALVAAGLTMAVQITFMLEFHKAGHRPTRGRLVRTLQRCRLLLAPEHHLQHHAGDHDSHYCLINGIADDTLGRWGSFRMLESAITAVTGVRPRRHDRELLARFRRASD